MSNAVKQGEFLAMIVRERLHKLIIKELKARIKVLEKALVKLDKDYENLKEKTSAPTNGK